jgi:TRAP transporter 4TM/12TM fusion protein
LPLWIGGLGLFIWYMFGWTPGGYVLEDITYYYLLYLCFTVPVFLCLPARKRDRFKTPWYDIVLTAIMFAVCLYYVLNAYSIARDLWIPAKSTIALIVALVTVIIGLEGGRRIAGTWFVGFVLLFGTYPLYAEHMPGILYGVQSTVPQLAAEFAYGRLGMLGLPVQTTGEILIGFLMFSGMMLASGAAQFFIDIALALLGRFRGGPAKVSVLASCFFGTLSGSAIANVVGTGSVTIPAMKSVGYPPHYAGAVEAVASSGGAIMPPVMGAIAFILSILTGIPYSTVMIAAALPAILYYWCLLVQVDAYAARVGLIGLPRERIPSIRKTLKWGWPFLLVIIFLVFGLLYMRWESRAPVYATALMIPLSYLNRKTWLTPKKLLNCIVTISGMTTFMQAVLLPAAFLIMGFEVAGTITALTAQLSIIGQSSIWYVLLIAAALCFIIGTVGSAMIPYIVLAVTCIPAVAKATGLDVLGIHLFVIYWLLTGPITPPSCTVAFAGAALANADPMKTGWTSTRLALSMYIVPFFFVFQPALTLGRGTSYVTSIEVFLFALVGIGIMASAAEGYMILVGNLSWWARVILFVTGFLIAMPERMTTIIGIAASAALIALILVQKRIKRRARAALELPSGGA